MYNWSVFIITISSLAGLIVIVINYDSYTAGKLIKFLFFGSTTLVLFGLVMSAKIIFKKMKKRR